MEPVTGPRWSPYHGVVSPALHLSLLLLVVSSLGFTPRAGAQSVFFFTSSTTSYVGGGQTETLAPSDGFAITESQAYPNDDDVSFAISTPNESEWWFLNFSPVPGSTLQVGDTYTATR
jgi:hypothetical protein